MSKLIFFVDDDKMIINLLEYTFQSRQQYDVKSFESGEELLDELDQNPDLVVLDYCLTSSESNKMSGMETLEKIIESKPDLPVFILSGCADEKLFKEFLDKGAKECLAKDDYFIDTLIDKIGKLLN